MALRGRDVISGAYADIYCKIGDERFKIGWAKGIEAKITKNKTAIQALGSIMDKQKAARASGAGTLKLFYLDSRFRKRTIDFIKGAADTYLDFEVYVEDPASRAGQQATIIKDCNLDEILVAYADADSAVLEESIPFTFEDADMPQEFNQVEY